MKHNLLWEFYLRTLECLMDLWSPLGWSTAEKGINTSNKKGIQGQSQVSYNVPTLPGLVNSFLSYPTAQMPLLVFFYLYFLLNRGKTHTYYKLVISVTQAFLSSQTETIPTKQQLPFPASLLPATTPPLCLWEFENSSSSAPL